MGDYQHYVRVVGGMVVHGFSSAFESPRPGDICIDGDAPRHFQRQLINDAGQYLYKWQGDEIVLRDSAELENELSDLPPAPPTPDQRIEQLEAENAKLKSDNLMTLEAVAEVYELFLTLGGG